MSSVAVRRVRSDEWQAVRELRLESTSDPDANIAFLETPAQVAARSEQFWRERAELAAGSETAAQFVAVVDDAWVGSLSVLVRATGQTDHLGRFVDDRRADVVGVYVNPAHRGTGAIDLLLAAAAEWVTSLGLTRLSLDVHRDNPRAQGAYRRAGFVPTGETFTSVIGPEIVMARPLP
ncbi:MULTISPECIES: GNAT family N-acetyltransferase [Microbacterium]|uniref:GNAT family N-acetyltransferase n=1 Tax=Microbacterium TaxID=33882 RepID=UPI0006F9465F|nr:MULTISPECIES: GNAT family N-acetyltransferase [Microbacterium]KQP71255.1 acetyltransferase [Microbacterium sp. Leaf288]MDR7111850.1 GNAT superfamily N-acetyltransferase [Microbacterium trichothecenolyticum]MDT0143607.1 GNAT family N-acetyltransferase [Microbacterium sp. PRC9]